MGTFISNPLHVNTDKSGLFVFKIVYIMVSLEWELRSPGNTVSSVDLFPLRRNFPAQQQNFFNLHEAEPPLSTFSLLSLSSFLSLSYFFHFSLSLFLPLYLLSLSLTFSISHSHCFSLSLFFHSLFLLLFL